MAIFTSKILREEDSTFAEIPFADEHEDLNEDEVQDATTGEIDPDPIDVPEELTDYVEEGYFAIAQNEHLINTLMEGVGMYELSRYAATGKDFVYESAESETFIQKVKATFAKIINKVKELVNHFISYMMSVIVNGKKFVKENEEAIREGHKLLTNKKSLAALNAKGEAEFSDEIQGYKFSNLDWTPDHINYYITTDDMMTIRSKEDYEKIFDSFRGKALDTSKVTEGEFADKIFVYFHGDSKVSAQKLSGWKVNDALDNLVKNGYYIKQAKSNFNQFKTEVGKAVKYLESFIKSADDPGFKAARKTYGKDIATNLNAVKKIVSIAQQVYYGQLQAFKHSYIQDRRIAAMCIRAYRANSVKAEPKQESANVSKTPLSYVRIK